MKHENRLIIASAITAFCIVAAVILSAWNISGAEASSPRIFIGDDVWSSGEQYPPENIFGVCYVPLSVFSGIEGVTIKENTNINNVMISRGDRYITFDLNNNKMYTQDGAENIVATYLIYVGQRYVPAHIVCVCLGMSLETDGNAVRIGDGSEKLSFGQLLEKYSLSAQTTVTEAPKITDSPVISEKVTDNVRRTVCFTFTAGKLTKDILDILGEYGVRATFFVTPDFIENDYAALRMIMASGMEIGITGEYRGEDDDFIEGIEKANHLLHDLTKKSTRLYTSDKTGLRLIEKSDSLRSSLKEKGYTPVYINNSMVYIPRTKVGIMEYDAEKFISENELTVFSFPDDENTLNTLPLILKYIAQRENITPRPVTEGFLLK